MSGRIRNCIHNSVILLVFASLIAGQASVASGTSSKRAPSRVVEVRAVWLDRRSIPNTETGIRSLVRQYSDAGFNVLFPEVIYNGYSAYPSSYFVQDDIWNGLDVMEILCAEAHRLGMEVHAWVWAFRAGHAQDAGGLLSRYARWQSLDSKGTSDAQNVGYWITPCSSAARRLLVRGICEIVKRYPVDGIHLDYVRFPSSDYGYEPSCRDRFHLESGADPAGIQPFTPEYLKWHIWREDCVNRFVSETRQALEGTGADVKLSVAVPPNLQQARLRYLQNWEYWVANKWVDFLCPMTYAKDLSGFQRMVEDTHAAVGYRTLLVPGIGVHLQDGSQTMLEQVSLSRSLPCVGVALFSGSYLDESRIRALADSVFRERASVPFGKPVESASTMASCATRKLSADTDSSDLMEAGHCLRTAYALIEYARYVSADVQPVPKKPPVFVPKSLQPIPYSEIPILPSAPSLDGRLAEAEWDGATQILLRDTEFGCPAAIVTSISIGYWDSSIYIAGRMPVCRNEDPKADVMINDGPVFTDDSLEIFLSREEMPNDYIHLALNSKGVKYDARVYDVAFTPDWPVAVNTDGDSWIAEICIPVSMLGIGQQPTVALRANFCRNRLVSGNSADVERVCWSPTYGSFHTPIRFGRLIIQEARDASCED